MYFTFPDGLVQTVPLGVSETGDGRRVSDAVVVPDWAQSYSVYQQGLNVDAATAIRVKVAPPSPATPTFVAMDENPVETGKGEIASSVVRHKPCTPREKMRAECDVAVAGNDTQVTMVWVFSVNPAVNA